MTDKKETVKDKKRDIVDPIKVLALGYDQFGMGSSSMNPKVLLRVDEDNKDITDEDDPEHGLP